LKRRTLKQNGEKDSQVLMKMTRPTPSLTELLLFVLDINSCRNTWPGPDKSCIYTCPFAWWCDLVFNALRPDIAYY